MNRDKSDFWGKYRKLVQGFGALHMIQGPKKRKSAENLHPCQKDNVYMHSSSVKFEEIYIFISLGSAMHMVISKTHHCKQLIINLEVRNFNFTFWEKLTGLKLILGTWEAKKIIKPQYFKMLTTTTRFLHCQGIPFRLKTILYQWQNRTFISCIGLSHYLFWLIHKSSYSHKHLNSSFSSDTGQIQKTV